MRSSLDIHTLLAMVPAIFFKGYKDWSVDFFDNKVEELTGYAVREFNERTKKWSDLIVAEDMASARARFIEALKSDGLCVRDYRIRSKTDATRWIQERNRIVFDEKGNVATVFGFFFDITEFKHMQVELAVKNEELRIINLHLEEEVRKGLQAFLQSECRYRMLFENTKDLILLADANWCISKVNPSALAHLGYAAEDEIVGRPLAHLFPDSVNYDDYKQRLLQHALVEDWETQFLKKDGSVLDVAISADAMFSGKTVIGLNVVARAMKEWRNIMEHMLQTEKLATIGQLAAGIAHEINTPLGVILAHAQILQDDFDPQSRVFQSLQTIEQQTHICRRIGWDLLEFTRQMPNVYMLWDIHRLLDDVIKIMDHPLKIDRIEILRSFSPNLPEIWGDAEKLKRVFINAINNAHDAIGTDGVILIATGWDEKERMVKTVVADSGCGIPSAIGQRIFQPFFTTKETSKGTGLGLSIAQSILQEHGGTIEVESPLPEELKALMEQHVRTPPGPGAAFTVRLRPSRLGP